MESTYEVRKGTGCRDCEKTHEIGRSCFRAFSCDILLDVLYVSVDTEKRCNLNSKSGTKERNGMHTFRIRSRVVRELSETIDELPKSVKLAMAFWCRPLSVLVCVCVRARKRLTRAAEKCEVGDGAFGIVRCQYLVRVRMQKLCERKRMWVGRWYFVIISLCFPLRAYVRRLSENGCLWFYYTKKS